MLKRFVDVRDEEVRAVLGSFVYFFTLMCGYAILRPIRNEMGTAGSVKGLPWLFTATFIVMLLAVPAFSALVARWPRRVVLPRIYRFFLVSLLAFFVLLKLDVAREPVARVFYIWLSVYNLFVVSIFWSFMADVFAGEQGKRLFGFIAAGGTTGMLVGPFLVGRLAEPVGPVNLILVSAVLLEVSAQCVRWLSRWARDVQHQPLSAEAPVGGGVLAGLRLLVASPLLLALGLQVLLYAATSTFLYFQEVKLVAEVGKDAASRTALFGDIDFYVQLLTLALQTLVTGRIISRLGLGAALAVAPVLTGLGFLGLAAVPVLGVLVAFKALRGASHYALERPSREILFTTVDREARYKSKSFIDTVVYRGSDTVSAWLQGGLTALGLGMTGLSLAAVPLAGLWLGVSLYLGREQRRLSREAGGALAPVAADNAAAR
ncbi:MFS transporter [Myxococcus sp. CA051A]|uniref:MFS transporter n=1 Tax=Myxococcus llanfairpwllgwyngyllgogerychwyrndrobwllllantysiliogogogochensis TaxID=2590453 RepID=A0A540WJH5_9BACT|nr:MULTISPECIES: MFS transporter [Myxococcus]NTX09953.1 MFS transporter [Myxococcus sp. CA056]NTX35316.1 MFS transporter [Myxococcus sp. CA033]NTX57610.1 MFS transporter [Myxococcus sp. CA039A]NTX64415.1 MFS transporter [Myxococcus sp. CA051A]TQF09148.1 MFS transporter [Myxococcus llanfairpwllgwyngyllgogerychwyrndrobwllllantysiliogogogochensis]